jgi:hypothetical protein
MTISRLTQLLALIGGAYSLAVALWMADYSSLGALPGLAMLLFIVAAPFALGYHDAANRAGPAWARMVVLLAVAGATAFSLFVYTWFVWRSEFDAQDGLLFLFVPLYQLVLVGGAKLLIGLVRRVVS